VRGRSWLLVASLAAVLSCSGQPPASSLAARPTQDAVCRTGPGGAPDDPALFPREADRGIGGTGLQADGQPSDRGIGGTGIVGAITGFASVCVDGLEVAVGKDTVIRVDGSFAPASDLRAGQIAVIAARGPESGLIAEDIAIRHEIAGPVTAVGKDGAVLMVADQPVVLAPSAWVLGARDAGPGAVRPGDWVAVSGLHRPDGAIVATRVDRVARGEVMVRGRLVQHDGTWRIGALPLRFAAGLAPPIGAQVQLGGRYDGASLAVAELAADPVLTAPVTAFGSKIDHMYVESFVAGQAGGLILGGEEVVARPPDVAIPTSPGAEIVELQRAPNGQVTVSDLHASLPPGAGSSEENGPPPAGLRRSGPAPPPSGPGHMGGPPPSHNAQ
jgi:hypothetical protein